MSDEGPREWSPRADLRRRLDQALQRGDNAFWAEIAKAFPEVKGGDFPPDLTARWTRDIGDAVLQWLLLNHPNAVAIERSLTDEEKPATSPKGRKGWMLRTSPHNEDFIFVAASSLQELARIAERYVREMFSPVEFIESHVDIGKKTVTVSYGEHADVEGDRQTFYISEIKIL